MAICNSIMYNIISYLFHECHPCGFMNAPMRKGMPNISLNTPFQWFLSNGLYLRILSFQITYKLRCPLVRTSLDLFDNLIIHLFAALVKKKIIYNVYNRIASYVTIFCYRRNLFLTYSRVCVII